MNVVYLYKYQFLRGSFKPEPKLASNVYRAVCTGQSVEFCEVKVYSIGYVSSVK